MKKENVMNCKRLILFVAFCAALVPAQRPARGESGGDEGALKYLLKQYDANKDGKIEASEYKRGQEKFARLDKNSDGVINKDDFSGRGGRGGRGGQGERGGRGGQGERGGRGAGAMLGRFFSRYLDADGDKKVTKGDWDKFLETCAASNDDIVTDDGFEKAGGNPRMLRFMGRILDGNSDGDITRGELAKAFAMVDTNKDGQVSGEELGTGGRAGRGGQGRGGQGRGGRERGGRRGELPQVGNKAPDFTLPSTDDPKKLLTLSDFAGDRPVALIFGSYT